MLISGEKRTCLVNIFLPPTITEIEFRREESYQDTIKSKVNML